MPTLRSSIKQAVLATLPPRVRAARAIRHLDRQMPLEEPELLELRRFVRPADTAVDVGGNYGLYTLALSRLARRVITVEPNPKLASALIGLRLPNVEVKAIGLSSENGSATLMMPDRADGHAYASLRANVHDGGAVQTFTVPIKRLDDMGLGEIQFIKIDVEGFEEQVLDGAEETIRRWLPVLLIELEQRHNPGCVGRVAERLVALGYTGQFFDGSWKPLADFDVVAHQDVGRLQGLGSVPRLEMGYINNFLFLPPGRTMD